MFIDSLIPADFSDVIVVAFSPKTGKSFIADSFKSFGKAKAFVDNLKRFSVPYDFVVGDYTYRRTK